MEKFKIEINGEEFEIAGQFPNGSDIKHFAKVPQSYGVWLKGNRKLEDKEIGHSEIVDLKQPGIKQFYTGHRGTTEG